MVIIFLEFRKYFPGFDSKIMNKSNRSSNKLFIREFIKRPREIGSVFPSSLHLARRVAGAVKTLPKLDVVQIGAGTGTITQFLPKDKTTVIEINENLVEKLRDNFAEVNIINNCGVAYLSEMESEFGCVITIPLINNPITPNLLRTLQSLYDKKILKWCVIYSYGLFSPLKEVDFKFTEKSSVIWRNFPPARVWTYY